MEYQNQSSKFRARNWVENMIKYDNSNVRFKKSMKVKFV